MRNISILEFRKKARQILSRAQKGERMIMTYRGKPVMRLEPIRETAILDNDPFYRLPELAAPSKGNKSHLSNHDMDRIIYGL